MSIFVSNDRISYRRWVNLVPSVILPGGGQFLSGRRKAGLIWFGISLLYVGPEAFVVFSPYLTAPWIPKMLSIFDIVFLVCLCADACRRPIARLGFKRWLAFVIVAVAIPVPILFVRQFLLQPFYIPTGGMQPTLMGKTMAADGREKPGDSIMVDKLSYRLGNPRRGDIVVFRTAGLVGLPQDEVYVKRIVGLPGERVSIRSHSIYINGERTLKPPALEKIPWKAATYPSQSRLGRFGLDGEGILLGKDEYLVLGENTQNSYDGRYYGPIKRKSIVGRVVWIYAPPERKGWPE